jgi:hypothetical protein
MPNADSTDDEAAFRTGSNDSRAGPIVLRIREESYRTVRKHPITAEDTRLLLKFEEEFIIIRGKLEKERPL